MSLPSRKKWTALQHGLLANFEVYIFSYYRASKWWMRAPHCLSQRTALRDSRFSVTCLTTWHAFVNGQTVHSSGCMTSHGKEKIRYVILGIRRVSHFCPARVVSTLHTGSMPNRNALQDIKFTVSLALKITVPPLWTNLHTEKREARNQLTGKTECNSGF